MKKFITRKEFSELHKCCPVCGNENLLQTLAGYPQSDDKDYEDHNSAECMKNPMIEEMKNGCGWSGSVMKLVPKMTIEKAT